MEKVTVYENTLKPQQIYEPASSDFTVQEVIKYMSHCSIL